MGNAQRRGSVSMLPETAGVLATRKTRSGSAHRRHVAGLTGERGNVMRGTMTKRGRVRKNWKERFFVLEDGLLSYYMTEKQMYQGDNPKGVVLVKHLLPWQAFHGADDKSGATGMVVVGEDNRALHIMAPTKEVRAKWEEALKEAAALNNVDKESEPVQSENARLKMKVTKLEEENARLIGVRLHESGASYAAGSTTGDETKASAEAAMPPAGAAAAPPHTGANTSSVCSPSPWNGMQGSHEAQEAMRRTASLPSMTAEPKAEQPNEVPRGALSPLANAQHLFRHRVSSADGGEVDSTLVKHASLPSMTATPVAMSTREWLDEIRKGFGASFGACFEEVGAEDIYDLIELQSSGAWDATEQLLKEAGCKPLQMVRIKKAVGAISGGLENESKPTPVHAGDLARAGRGLAAVGEEGTQDKPVIVKEFACFISHHKASCAMEARFIKNELERLTDRRVFLDSDDLSDLNALVGHVRASECLVVLQTKEVFERPWCLVEVATALTARIPIVTVKVDNNYDFAQQGQFLEHLDTELAKVNPGAPELVLEAGYSPITLAWMLSSTIPMIISKEFNPSATQNAILASLLDLAEAILAAKPVEPARGFEEWKEHRDRRQALLPREEIGKVSQQVASEKPSTTSITSGGAHELARCPQELPLLPDGYFVRKAILSGIKRRMFPSLCEESVDGESKEEAADEGCRTIVVVGMGGSGKTVVASALARERGPTAIATKFESICYVPVGQNPLLRDLQRLCHVQLTGMDLPSALETHDEVFSALCTASAGKDVLVIVDDAWDKSQVAALNIVDPNTESRILVTSRVKGMLGADSAEFELGLLTRYDAVALLLEVGEGELPENKRRTPPFTKLECQAADLCGCLPLLLSIAGGMLEQHGGAVDEAFISLLSEDNCEVLREGEYGDLMVSLEDRLIHNSLKQYKGRDKEQVAGLFRFFAVFPEDVTIPERVLKELAPLLGCEGMKRPGVKIRSWVSALLRGSLLKGSHQGGVYMHDIVRHFAICQHTPAELRRLQLLTTNALLDSRPPGTIFAESVEAAHIRTTATWYATHHLWWHIRGSLEGGDLTEQLNAVGSGELTTVDTSKLDGVLQALDRDQSILSRLVRDHDQQVNAMVVMSIGKKTAEAYTAWLEVKSQQDDAILWRYAICQTRFFGLVSESDEYDLLVRIPDLMDALQEEGNLRVASEGGTTAALERVKLNALSRLQVLGLVKAERWQLEKWRSQILSMDATPRVLRTIVLNDTLLAFKDMHFLIEPDANGDAREPDSHLVATEDYRKVVENLQDGPPRGLVEDARKAYGDVEGDHTQ